MKLQEDEEEEEDGDTNLYSKTVSGLLANTLSP